MQKREYLMLGLILFIAVFAVVGHMPVLLAQNNSGSDSDDDDSNNSGSSDDDDSDDDTNERDKTRLRIKEVIREGNCTIKVEREIKFEDGKRVEEIKKKMKCADGTETEFKLKIENRTEDGRFREKFKFEFKGDELEVEAEDEIDLEEGTNGTEYELKAKMRNGNFTKIKIMPDQASEIALARLRALNFTVQLRERIHDKVPQVVYNIEANKSGRFLGVFKLAMKTSAEVDPETGEVLDVNTPWWAFLVAQQDETQTTTGGNETNTTTN